MKTIYKAYKFRLYPNKEQENLIQKTFGCCRFVYNQLLAQRISYYEENKQSLKNDYTCLLEDFPFLKEVEAKALQESRRNLDVAYKNFFEGLKANKNTGFPKFKSKHNNHKSYSTVNGNNYTSIKFTDDRHIKLPKLGSVRLKRHRNLPENSTVKSATIKQVPSGKYYISILVAEEYEELESIGNIIGIDLGVKDLVITSDGDKFDNIKTTKKYEKKLAKQQKRLAKKQKNSNRRNKQQIKVAKVYEKITNVRKDYLHKVSHKLISDNQVIISENLKVSNMVKNHHLAKSIEDASWSMLTSMIEYKSNWNDRNYLKIDTFYPSSKTCSNCGYKLEQLDLDTREWICPSCGQHHDRDVNAAINIRNEGMRLLNS